MNWISLHHEWSLPLICRHCRTNNPESSLYCESCGQPLIRRPGTNKIKVAWIVLFAGLLVFFGGGYFIVKIILRSPKKDMPSYASGTRGGATQTVPSDLEEQYSSVGEVTVKDLEGREISRLTASVFNDNWIALPVWSILEGKRLTFQREGSEEAQINEGVWTNGDPLVFFKLEAENPGQTPALFPWKQHLPLEWHSFIKTGSFFLVDIDPPDKRGTLFSFPLPGEIQGLGLFKQEGHIVGWSYPEHLDKGYLWAGPAGTDLFPNLHIERFLNFHLPQWRETHFNAVLNMGEGTPAVRRLEAFAEGFRMPSPFYEEDISHELRLRSIVDRMHTLASELISNGFAKDVIRILDENVIIQSHDLSLTKDSALARVQSEDYNRAIQFLGRIKKNIFETRGQGISGLDQFHAELYKDWLKNILDQGGYYNGMVAFEEAKRVFPDDIDIHLLGVEVALAEKNWVRARELLQMRDYPENLRDWAGELENEIQEVEENEGSITIRFNPGANHIPVKVYLNGTHSFRFILDTGATVCSIPTSAVEKLRIDIDQTTPLRLISTAGGFAETYEVKLKSVELEGYRVSNVGALIIDIPGYRDYGLLGQNFLNKFHIEIDNQKGILRLRKR
jgi:clan AA aspartic protease (TIGR02281 family)